MLTPDSKMEPESVLDAAALPSQVPPPGVPFDFEALGVPHDYDVTAPIHKLYEMGDELGRGAFSVVYKALCRQTGEEVAVKVVSYNTFKPGDVERQKRILENEVRIMQKIAVECAGNAHLIRLKRVVREPNRMGIVMELLEGRELFERIVHRKKYTERDAAHLMVKIMKAVAALHRVGILHRDLKPENLVFATEGEEDDVKITDFGLGRVSDWPDVHNSVVGTPNYVAPEVVSIRPRGPFYGRPCDVWSMGVILYILLVGYPPFYHEVPRELFKQIRRGKYEFHEKQWEGISDEAKDLVRRMLVVDRFQRITTEQVLQHPWILSKAPQRQLDGTLIRLKSLNAKRRFKAAAMAVVWGVQLGMRRKLLSLVDQSDANVFNLTELSRIRETFYRNATEGRMNIPAFRRTLSELGFNDMPVERLFGLFDQNGDGYIEYKELLSNLATLKESGTNALKLCFKIYDDNDTGFISREQVKKVLTSVLPEEIRNNPLAVEASLERTFQSMDSDGDGRISYDEFTKGIFETGPVLVEQFLGPLDRLSTMSIDEREQRQPGYLNIADFGEEDE